MVKSHSFAVVAAALAVTAALAVAADPSSQQLQSELQQLRAEVQQLKAQQSMSTHDVDAAVARVLDDADRRSRFMAAEGMTAGYDPSRGFILQSADGSFLMHPYLQFQPRYVANMTDSDAGDDSETGFEVRRLKLGFDGNVINDRLAYAFQWATSRSTSGNFELEDAWMRYRFADTWAVRAGQFKDALAHEGLVSSTRQLAAESSLLNQVLQGSTANYVQGVSLIYDNDALANPVRAEVAFHDGFDTQNTGWEADPYNFGISGRGEIMLQGKSWKAYNDFTALGNKDDLLVLGAGADWSQSGDTNALWHSFDVQWEPQSVKGLGVFAAYTGRAIDDGDDEVYDWGGLVQAGYLLDKNWEIFGRYDFVEPDADDADTIHEFTAGVNYYFRGHNAKCTFDLTYLPDGAPSLGGAGILASDDEQFVARLQFQLLI